MTKQYKDTDKLAYDAALKAYEADPTSQTKYQAVLDAIKKIKEDHDQIQSLEGGISSYIKNHKIDGVTQADADEISIYMLGVEGQEAGKVPTVPANPNPPAHDISGGADKVFKDPGFKKSIQDKIDALAKKYADTDKPAYDAALKAYKADPTTENYQAVVDAIGKIQDDHDQINTLLGQISAYIQGHKIVGVNTEDAQKIATYMLAHQEAGKTPDVPAKPKPPEHNISGEAGKVFNDPGFKKKIQEKIDALVKKYTDTDKPAYDVALAAYKADPSSQSKYQAVLDAIAKIQDDYDQVQKLEDGISVYIKGNTIAGVNKTDADKIATYMLANQEKGKLPAVPANPLPPTHIIVEAGKVFADSGFKTNIQDKIDALVKKYTDTDKPAYQAALAAYKADPSSQTKYQVVVDAIKKIQSDHDQINTLEGGISAYIKANTIAGVNKADADKISAYMLSAHGQEAGKLPTVPAQPAPITDIATEAGKVFADSGFKTNIQDKIDPLFTKYTNTDKPAYDAALAAYQADPTSQTKHQAVVDTIKKLQDDHDQINTLEGGISAYIKANTIAGVSKGDADKISAYMLGSKGQEAGKLPTVPAQPAPPTDIATEAGKVFADSGFKTNIQKKIDALAKQYTDTDKPAYDAALAAYQADPTSQTKHQAVVDAIKKIQDDHDQISTLEGVISAYIKANTIAGVSKGDADKISAYMLGAQGQEAGKLPTVPAQPTPPTDIATEAGKVFADSGFKTNIQSKIDALFNQYTNTDKPAYDSALAAYQADPSSQTKYQAVVDAIKKIQGDHDQINTLEGGFSAYIKGNTIAGVSKADADKISTYMLGAQGQEAGKLPTVPAQPAPPTDIATEAGKVFADSGFKTNIQDKIDALAKQYTDTDKPAYDAALAAYQADPTSQTKYQAVVDAVKKIQDDHDQINTLEGGISAYIKGNTIAGVGKDDADKISAYMLGAQGQEAGRLPDVPVAPTPQGDIDKEAAAVLSSQAYKDYYNKNILPSVNDYGMNQRSFNMDMGVYNKDKTRKEWWIVWIDHREMKGDLDKINTACSGLAGYITQNFPQYKNDAALIAQNLIQNQIKPPVLPQMPPYPPKS